MSDMTVEKKLALVQQVRSRYNENQYDLSNRERILYGKTGMGKYEAAVLGYEEGLGESYENGSENPAASYGQGVSTFNLRLFISAILLIGFILLEQNGGTVAGFSASQIYKAISADYVTQIETMLTEK